MLFHHPDEVLGFGEDVAGNACAPARDHRQHAVLSQKQRHLQQQRLQEGVQEQGEDERRKSTTATTTAVVEVST